MTDVIDLRSDTVTQPTPEMRRAIADAEVGDAVIDIDPTVQRLEEFTADLLGMPAAVFMPSGSMTNQVAIRVHCDRGSEFLCESEAHIYHYEQAAFAQLSGLVAHTIHTENGVMRREHLEGNVRPENEHMVRTRLLCVENTHNRWGGRIQPQDAVEDICQWATENGLKRHLDGARLWNAAAATGISERDLVAPFDSVSVCYSKGLGAPVGSALVGSEDFLYEVRRARKLFGGGMRQAGIIAAGALHAMQHHRDRLPEDHDHAQRLADACEASPSLSIRGGRVDTNIIICEIDPAWGTAAEMVAMCKEQGVLSLAVGPQAIRFVTHLDVNRSQIDRASEIIRTLTESPIPKSV